jgi:hypothetical protein
MVWWLLAFIGFLVLLVTKSMAWDLLWFREPMAWDPIWGTIAVVGMAASGFGALFTLLDDLIGHRLERS